MLSPEDTKIKGEKMKNTGTIIGLVLIVGLAVLWLSSAGMMGFGMMGHGMMGGYGGMMGGYGNQFGFSFNPIGAIISIVVWALIISGIVLSVVWLIRNANRSGQAIRSSESPLDILKARYARGEITKEQFDAIKQDLSA